MAAIFNVREKTTRRYTAVLKDETGAAVGSGSLSSLKLTLYNKVDGAIINTRNQQNVLNLNGVTIDASGNLTWTMDPADNPIIDTTLSYEEHVALFEIGWAADAKKNNHEVIIRVENVNKIQ